MKGKKLEAEIVNKLHASLGEDGEIIRLYDSYSVRVIRGRPIIPPQAADVVFVRKGGYIEIKTTENELQWSLSQLRDKQRASCIKYGVKNSVISYYVLIYCIPKDTYYLLPASFIKERLESNRRGKTVVEFKTIEEFKFSSLDNISDLFS